MALSSFPRRRASGRPSNSQNFRLRGNDEIATTPTRRILLQALIFRRGIIHLLFAGFLLTGTAGAETLFDGLAAYDAGRYRAAARIWRALAEAGDVDAQTALAGLYRSGAPGFPNSASRAADWYRKAAVLGDGVAQMNLGDMHARGDGVAHDLIEAWFWLSRSEGQGFDWAAERRVAIERDMSSDEYRAASRRLAVWRKNRGR